MHSEQLTARFSKASQLHANQKRKGFETLYLSHLLGVASLIIEYGGDEDDVIAGLLHDAVEDCGGLLMLDEIRREFGGTVANTVTQFMDSVTADPGGKPQWVDRKRACVAAVAGKSDRARFATACDKLHNAAAVLNDRRLACTADAKPVLDRVDGKTREQTVAYYSAAVGVLQGQMAQPLWRRLAATVSALGGIDTRQHRIWLSELRAPVQLDPWLASVAGGLGSVTTTDQKIRRQEGR